VLSLDSLLVGSASSSTTSSSAAQPSPSLLDLLSCDLDASPSTNGTASTLILPVQSSSPTLVASPLPAPASPVVLAPQPALVAVADSPSSPQEVASLPHDIDQAAVVHEPEPAFAQAVEPTPPHEFQHDTEPVSDPFDMSDWNRYTPPHVHEVPASKAVADADDAVAAAMNADTPQQQPANSTTTEEQQYQEQQYQEQQYQEQQYQEQQYQEQQYQEQQYQEQQYQEQQQYDDSSLAHTSQLEQPTMPAHESVSAVGGTNSSFSFESMVCPLDEDPWSAVSSSASSSAAPSSSVASLTDAFPELRLSHQRAGGADLQLRSMQCKSLLRWVNFHVTAAGDFEPLDDLTHGLTSGVALVRLVERLSGRAIEGADLAPTGGAEMQHNISLAIAAFVDAGFALPHSFYAHGMQAHVDAADVSLHWYSHELAEIASGSKTSTTMELVWSMFVSAELGSVECAGEGGALALLYWLQSRLQGYPVSVHDFSTSWVDGVALCSLIYRTNPDKLDYSAISRVRVLSLCSSVQVRHGYSHARHAHTHSTRRSTT